ncbi:hypothetical protein IGI37_002406 [Enterococcus sp. AZ194]|uniref:hypothetical protein n=1 Tax=Enterococcus sp. AZ194 TaxID=2774629 RepID=UPI003F298C57
MDNYSGYYIVPNFGNGIFSETVNGKKKISISLAEKKLAEVQFIDKQYTFNFDLDSFEILLNQMQRLYDSMNIEK